jgi:hypothetical protein
MKSLSPAPYDRPTYKSNNETISTGIGTCDIDLLLGFAPAHGPVGYATIVQRYANPRTTHPQPLYLVDRVVLAMDSMSYGMLASFTIESWPSCVQVETPTVFPSLEGLFPKLGRPQADKGSFFFIQTVSRCSCRICQHVTRSKTMIQFSDGS